MKRILIFITALVIAITIIFSSVPACEFSSGEPATQPIKKPVNIAGRPDEPVKVEPEISEGGFYTYENAQPPYYGSDPNKPVVLINNEAATNPTLQELKHFLKADNTDENDYIPGLRVCAEFAAELHNNAEEAGIRAAWVAIEFEDNSEGHAINAFETTNAGFVFIDNTGSIPVISIPDVNPDNMDITETECFDTNDKKAYVKIGYLLGFIGLDVPFGTDYEHYINYINAWSILESRSTTLLGVISEYSAKVEEHNIRVEDFNKQVDKYTSLVAGRDVIEDENEYQMLSRMYDELKQLESEVDLEYAELEQERNQINEEIFHVKSETENLGNCRREPLGVVKTVEIYW